VGSGCIEAKRARFVATLGLFFFEYSAWDRGSHASALPREADKGASALPRRVKIAKRRKGSGIPRQRRRRRRGGEGIFALEQCVVMT
jgi:hypothetical protein